MSNDPIAELSRTISVHWKAIDEAAATAQKKRSELAKLFSHGPINYVPGDTNIVVFGSLARNELTSQSDLDWTLLIDGHANANHQKTAIGIKKLIEAKNAEIGLKPPGPTGIFGSMTFSHDLIHRIGGEADTNRNMTQRILLLLESANLADNGSGAHDRVKAGILNRYLEEQEPNYLTRTDEQYRVPRFLLNDIVRFWRTMAVDFASKQRDRGGDGWGLRNAKLRMSRKLIFVSGLLTCFNAHLQVPVNPELKQPDAQIEPILNFLKQQAKLTPLEILADTVLTLTSIKLPFKDFLILTTCFWDS
jgi:predicted nucleotidyltransferase